MTIKTKTIRPINVGVIFTSTIAAIILGALEITFVLAYAALIFPAEVSAYFNEGIAILLLGTALCLTTIAIFSSYSGSIASAQDIPASITAVMAASIISAFGVGANTYVMYSTVIAAMAAASLLSATLLLTMAFTGLGNLIRFIPYPVIGGLLISTGWILSEAGLGMMPDQWLIGTIFAVCLLIIQRYFSSPWALPSFLLVSIVAVNIYLIAIGMPVEDARDNGFLLNVDLDRIPLVFSPILIANSADWDVLLKQLPTIISLSLITCIVVLIQISSIEVIVKQEMNPKHELYVTGLANMLVAFCCGLIGYHHISSTSLIYNLGTKSRFVGLLVAAICMLVFFTDTRWMEHLPVPILGGLILYLGLDFLYEWLFQTYRKVPKSEYIIMLLIFACAILINFPAAILLGVICGFILTAFQYNKTGIVKAQLHGSICQSSVMRSTVESNYLITEKFPVAAFKLNGMLYFGTANDLYKQTRNLVANSKSTKIKYLIVDFEGISNIDTTALMNLTRTHEFLAKSEISLIYSSLNDEQINLIKSFYDGNELKKTFSSLKTLDHGIEEYENRLLMNAGLYDNKQLNSLDILLKAENWDDDSIDNIKNYLQQEILQNNQYLIRTDETDDHSYLITSGRVNIVANNADGSVTRLRVLKPGMIIGEISLYTGSPRSADVVSNGISTVYKLSSASLELLQIENPALAIKVHKFFAKQMAERLIDENRLQSIRKV